MRQLTATCRPDLGSPVFPRQGFHRPGFHRQDFLRGYISLVLALWVYCACPLSAFASQPSVATGKVTINTQFAGGNVLVGSNVEGKVELGPDLRGDSEWFYWYFEAVASQAGRVDFVFPEKVIGFPNGAIGLQGPAISRDNGRTWDWFGTDNVQGRSFFYEFTTPGERVRFAVTIPYVQSNLKEFLDRHAGNPHLTTSVLTKSRKGREVELLQIGTPGQGKNPMIVTARHHATETIASYVMEGFLDAAMSEQIEGIEFRKHYVLFAVPFVDKDGVEDGDQGKNRKPHDHNRDYGKESIYPEVQAIKALDQTQNFKFSLDLHCPTLVMQDHQVMYFVGPKQHPKYNFENVTQFATIIKQGLPENAPFGPLVWLRDEADPSPKNSGYFGLKEGTVLAATLEIPFAPPGKATDAESCRRYGQIILRAWVNTHFRGPLD